MTVLHCRNHAAVGGARDRADTSAKVFVFNELRIGIAQQVRADVSGTNPAKLGGREAGPAPIAGQPLDPTLTERGEKMMRISNLVRVGAVAAATVLSVQAASAQSWYAMPTPSNVSGNGFWNNRSGDNLNLPGTICNIGAVLLGTATGSTCGSIVPSGFLPLTPSQQIGSGGGYLASSGSNNVATSFTFTGGDFRFDLYGRVAGFAKGSPAGPQVGYFTYDGSGNRVLSAAFAAGSTTFSTTGQWGFWMTSFRPTGGMFYSDVSSQFALFTTLASAPTVSGGVVQGASLDRFWLGGEDNDGSSSPASDWDYQDISGSFTQLPEPASIALFGTGLLGMLAVGRRRRNAK